VDTFAAEPKTLTGVEAAQLPPSHPAPPPQTVYEYTQVLPPSTVHQGEMRGGGEEGRDGGAGMKRRGGQRIWGEVCYIGYFSS